MSNPTFARDIALHFFEVIKKKANRGEIARTINLAKKLLLTYRKEDIIDVINYYVLENPPSEGMYSLGFLLYGDNFVKAHTIILDKRINAERLHNDASKILDAKGDSTDRNKLKYQRTNKLSGFGEVDTGDLF